MRLAVLASCLLLASCVTAEYYSAQAPRSALLTLGASCSPTVNHYRRQLKEGVILEVGGLPSNTATVRDFGLTILLRIERGHSVQFQSSGVRVRILDDGTEKPLEIVGVSSGIPQSSGYDKLYDLPEIRLLPLARLEGTGRSAHITTRRGVYSPWLGEGDVFRLVLSAFAGAPNAVEVDLPPLEVDGEMLHLEPIRFVKETGSASCVQ